MLQENILVVLYFELKECSLSKFVLYYNRSYKNKLDTQSWPKYWNLRTPFLPSFESHALWSQKQMTGSNTFLVSEREVGEKCSSSICYKVSLSQHSKIRRRFILVFLKRIIFQLQTFFMVSQPIITCSKLTIETLEQGVKYVQS